MLASSHALLKPPQRRCRCHCRSSSSSSAAGPCGLRSRRRCVAAAAAALPAAFGAAAVAALDPTARVRDFDGNFGAEIPERLLAALEPDERQSVLLFQRAAPSVVNISTSAAAAPLFPLNLMQIPRGVGSGFVWDTKGHVVTNAHVVAGASEVKVTLYDGTSHAAKVVGADREKDVAVLRLLDFPRSKPASNSTTGAGAGAAAPAPPPPPVALGASSDLLVGQRVVAIGNPFGLDVSMSAGVVSGLGRELPAGPGGFAIGNCIQTDAAINPGNSGGPLLNSRGELVGINTAILSGSGSSSGVGFAIPIDSAKGLVAQILEFGRAVRPYLGVALAPATLARRLGIKGVVVLDVAPGGPAAAAGVRPSSRELLGTRLGDVVTGLNGRAVASERDLFAALDDCRPGQTVPLTVRGDGGRAPERKLQVKLAERSVSAGD